MTLGPRKKNALPTCKVYLRALQSVHRTDRHERPYEMLGERFLSTIDPTITELETFCNETIKVGSKVSANLDNSKGYGQVKVLGFAQPQAGYGSEVRVIGKTYGKYACIVSVSLSHVA